jgi:hypothetical protein
MTCKTTLVYYLLYITTVCPTPHFSPSVNHNSSILDLINMAMVQSSDSQGLEHASDMSSRE